MSALNFKGHIDVSSSRCLRLQIREDEAVRLIRRFNEAAVYLLGNRRAGCSAPSAHAEPSHAGGFAPLLGTLTRSVVSTCQMALCLCA